MPGFVRPDRVARTGGLCAAVVAASLVLSAGLPTARAQDTNLKGLIDRIERLQRDLNTLQRHVYRGEPPPAAAPAGGAELPRTQAARIEVRLSQFETELRALTGQVEEQSFRVNQMTQRLDSLVVDLDLRLQALEAGAAGLATEAGEPEAAAKPGAGQPAWDEGPKTLGKISEGDLAAAATSGQEAGTPRNQYDRAFALLQQSDYQGAERALAAFLDQYPSDPLAGNAKYWLGETYYVRGQYAEAAVAFAEGYQSYPDSVKAPDNLLKLGKSLAALDQTDDACGTFAELLKRYGSAAPAILQQAKSEQKRLSCK